MQDKNKDNSFISIDSEDIYHIMNKNFKKLAEKKKKDINSNEVKESFKSKINKIQNNIEEKDIKEEYSSINGIKILFTENGLNIDVINNSKKDNKKDYINITENKKEFKIKINLPYDNILNENNNINITVKEEKKKLIVEDMSSDSDFYEEIDLPENVKINSVKTKFTKSTLFITFNKKQTGTKIEIQD